jgi:predicted SprT family Zn-dependent metalloprotease
MDTAPSPRPRRAGKSSTVCYQVGPVYGAIIELPYDPDANEGEHYRSILVTNNGVVWSAEVMYGTGRVALAKATRLAGGVSIHLIKHSLEKAPLEWRLPVKWAKRTAEEVGKAYVVDAAQTSSSVAMDRVVSEGEIVYVGFETVSGRSAHTLSAIHQIVDMALLECEQTWSWDAGTIEVSFHTDSNAMGLAYNPGSGAKTGKRRISLLVKLLELYNEGSIARVALHELAHHYREERWPRDRRIFPDGHDQKFCEVLAAVDPLVNPSKRESYETFTESIDASVVAVAEKKLGDKVPVWSPDVGILVVSKYADGSFRLEWAPRNGIKKWKRWVHHVNSESLLEAARRFAVSDWNRVEVSVAEKTFPRLSALPTNLGELLAAFAKMFPQHLKPVIQYLNDVREEGGTHAPT